MLARCWQDFGKIRKRKKNVENLNEAEFFSEFYGPLMKVAKQIFLNFIPSRKDQQHQIRERVSNGQKNPGYRGEPPGRADRAQV